MGDEEIQITEAPEHTDARHSAVLRRHHVHIAVANVNRPVSIGVQLAQGFVHGIRSRFLPDILTLSYRHLYQVAEEMTAERLRCRIKLVAHHGNLLPPVLQFPQHLHHAPVRLRRVKIVHHVMLAEISIRLLKLLVLLAIRNGSYHQQLHAVAHKAAHLIQGSFGHSVLLQGVVAASRQVLQRGEQRTVKVEDVSIVVKLRMRRHSLYPEITAMQHADVVGKEAHLVGRTRGVSAVLLHLSVGVARSHRSVLAILPALEGLRLRIHHHIFIFQWRFQRHHVHREHPVVALQMDHRQIMFGVPFAQGRMVAQQSQCLVLVQAWGGNLENHGLLEDRQSCHLVALPLGRHGVVRHLSRQLHLVVEPEVRKDVVHVGIIGVGTGRTHRLPSHQDSLRIHHLIIIGDGAVWMMAVLSGMGLCQPVVTVCRVQCKIERLTLSVAREEGDVSMHRLTPLRLIGYRKFHSHIFIPY